MIGDWTRRQDPFALMYRLQGLGVPAGALHNARDALHSPQLWARRKWERIPREHTGTHEWPGPPFRLPAAVPRAPLAPPTLGEHNEYVCREIIGVSAEEYAGMVASGDVGTMVDEGIG